MAYIDNTRRIPKFGGTIWYVSKGDGSDSNNGLTPTTPFETIGAAITACSAGDLINVMAGTYTETGLDLDENNVELLFEIGAILNPASGDCLTISGNYCWVGCHDGALRINNDAAATTGVAVTGNWAYLEEIRVSCGGVGDHGFDLQGDGCDLRNCRASNLASGGYAFRIQGDKNRLENCCTGGDDASYGFYVDSTADKFSIKNCGSQGHTAGGYYIESGATNGVIEDSYSGGGDGKWRDLDNATIFSHFEYDETLHTNVTFTATGGVGSAGTNYNLFQVTGSVMVYDMYGIVTTVLPNTSTTPNLELYSTNASIDITDAAAGPDITDAVVGALLIRNEPAAEPLAYGNPDSTPAVTESTNFRNPKVPIAVTKDDAADTYIQLQLSSALASGAMRWYIKWEPLSEDGNVTQVNP